VLHSPDSSKDPDILLRKLELKNNGIKRRKIKNKRENKNKKQLSEKIKIKRHRLKKKMGSRRLFLN
jgi:hypothetical protein